MEYGLKSHEKNNMNIMFIIPRMGGGGAERVTAHIANYLSENDYDVTLTTFISGESFYSLNKEINYIGASCNVSSAAANEKEESAASTAPRTSRYSMYPIIQRFCQACLTI